MLKRTSPSQLKGMSASLSGGERQRLAIARALVRRPRVLLLDEATSALDSASEQDVQRTLQGLQQDAGVTIIVVAHRLSTLQRADCIAVMSRGQVVEQGTYYQLLRRNGKFARLVRAAEL